MEGQPVGTHDTKVWSTPVQSTLPLLSQRRVVGRKDADLKQAVSSCFFPSHFNSRRSTAGGSPANNSWRLNCRAGHSNHRGGSGSEDDSYWLVGSRGPAHAFFLWPFTFGRGRRRAAAKPKKRVMILMSDTGGGHRASAEALQAGFQQLYGDEYQVDYVDIWTNHTPYPFNQLPRTYSFMVRNSLIWRVGYYGQQPRFIHVPTQTISSLFVSRQVGEAFDRYKPDLVVSVHPLMQLVPLRVLRQQARKRGLQPVPFTTVVTDLTTCHNTWFHPGVDKCFVPTQYCKRSALKNGLKEEQIVVHGLPIRPVFNQRLGPKHRLRKQLGLDKHLPTVLIVGGGEGMGAIEKTLDALDATLGGACQVVAICGRNKALMQRLLDRSFLGGLKVKPCGFVTNMAEWMSASDVIITKAGPGTIAEALICGLPIILNGFIPCQEEGNVPFVVDNGLGAFERDPARIAGILQHWLGDREDEFRAIAGRARVVGEKWRGALIRIVADLAGLCEEAAYDRQQAALAST